MTFPKLTAFAMAGLMSIGMAGGVLAQDTSLIDPAIAAMSPEQKVVARQDAMKEDGGLLRGARKLTGADATAAADTLIHNFANFPGLFSEDTNGVGKTEALPVIWQNWEAFTAIFATGLTAAQGMKAAAEAGDAAAYAAALQTINGTCGTCHQQFRG